MAVVKVEDQNELVKSNSFPYANFPFEEFNPVQSRVFEFFNEDANQVIAAATSAGKTVCAELAISHEIRENGRKAMYLSPLRALAQEKIDDWTDESHHFSDLNLSICTGDYQLTADRKEELEAADLIIMTSEMLNSRSRNMRSEKSQFLKDVGVLVVDESHLLTVPNRGDHLEVGLMKFTKINPTARIVFLSATMPNVVEMGDWLSGTLTDKKTYLLESTYRPCPLMIYYEKCWDGGSTYDEKELEKAKHALSLVERYPDDKFLLFVHTKRTGELLKRLLQGSSIDCEFHNANLEKNKRIALENKFRTDPKFRVIIATSTLAWGLNLPARRVVVTGVHRGLSEVDNFDIWQMVGRAGRPAYDPSGDAYILLPSSNYDHYKDRLKKPQLIKSQLLENVGGHYKVLAFHLVSEIHHGHVKTVEDIYDWYERSLANWQAQDLEEDILEGTLALLEKCGAIIEDGFGLRATSVGKVASMFYYSPFDVSDLRKNFNLLFQSGHEDDDYYLSLALGNIDTHKFGIVSKLERESMSTYLARTNRVMPNMYEPAIKASYAYYELLRGRNPTAFLGLMRGLQFDFPRLAEVLKAIDSMSARWEQRQYLSRLNMRIKYGVRAELIDLCGIPNIGKVRAERLWASGIRTPLDVASNSGKVKDALKMKDEAINQICEAAKKMV